MNIFTQKDLKKVANKIYRYLMADGSDHGIIERCRLVKIRKILYEINRTSISKVPYDLTAEYIENKLEMVKILDSIRSKMAFDFLKTSTTASSALFRALRLFTKMIDLYFVRIANEAPEIAVRIVAIAYIRDESDLIEVASNKLNATSLRIEAIKKIHEQDYLESEAADLREPYTLRFEAVHNITDDGILWRIIENDKYDTVLRGVARDQLALKKTQ